FRRGWRLVLVSLRAIEALRGWITAHFGRRAPPHHMAQRSLPGLRDDRFHVRRVGVLGLGPLATSGHAVDDLSEGGSHLAPQLGVQCHLLALSGSASRALSLLGATG